MKIAIASDHAGFPLKETVVNKVKEFGHEVIDCGTHDELINRCSPYRDMWAAFEQSDQWKMGGVNA